MSHKRNEALRHVQHSMHHVIAAGEGSDRAPDSCKLCPYHRPDFKFRTCLYAHCPYKKQVNVFRSTPEKWDIHDKRVLKIISQMLKAGYMENDLFHATELGTPQGGILSPLLSNVYLNDFDWYVGRMYMEPHRQCKHKGNDTRRLKWAGVTPKYNYRYADDWVILTSTEKEALRLKRVLTKYFRNRMKLELSQEKTYVTDLRTNGIHFLGFVVKAERKRKTPDPATWTKHLVGKPLPDMERLGKKIKKLLEEVHRIELCQKVNAFTIFRLARTAGVSLPGKTKYLQQVYTIYNGGSRRAALPLKF